MILGLSLWMAFPAFQWCSASSICRAAMGMTCEVASTDDFAMSACPLEEECQLSGTSDAGLWCIGPHADGVTPRATDATPIAVALPFVEPIERASITPPFTRIRPDTRAGLCPGVIAAHAPPLTRAPPLAALVLAQPA